MAVYCGSCIFLYVFLKDGVSEAGTNILLYPVSLVLLLLLLGPQIKSTFVCFLLPPFNASISNSAVLEKQRRLANMSFFVSNLPVLMPASASVYFAVLHSSKPANHSRTPSLLLLVVKPSYDYNVLIENTRCNACIFNCVFT